MSRHEAKPSDPISIPLPDEIPPPPDLASLPSHILHSGTVETLLGLNDDLVARLKVNIRRNSVLEQQMMEQERAAHDLSRMNSSLTSQLQVLREKERIWREKTSRAEEAQETLRRLSAFQRRVRAWVRPLIDRLAKELESERSRAKSATERLNAREAQVSDLKARLADAISEGQSTEKKHLRDQTKIVEQYESRQKTLEADLEKARAELKLARDKALRLDEAVSQRTDLENKIVYLERRNTEMESAYRGEIHELQEQVKKYRSEAKILAVETLEYDQKLKRAMSELTELRSSHGKIQDQFESLQTVWVDAQKRLEASKLQQEALNRLNQELSRQLKEQRKEIEKAALAAAQESTEKDTTEVPTPPPVPAFNESKFGRIDALLAELESGFTTARAIDPTKPRDLDIVEDSPGA